jgi:4-hydroxybenzoate polyprenyltransferase
LGVGLSLAPIGAYLAVANQFNVMPIFLSLAVLCWVGGFDIIYALQDDEFDKSQKLKSIPVLLGRKNALLFSRFLHLLSAIFILLPGLLIPLGTFYFVGVFVFCGLLVYQHSLIKTFDLSKVNLAFFTTNGIASVLFLTFFLIDYLK